MPIRQIALTFTFILALIATACSPAPAPTAAPTSAPTLAATKAQPTASPAPTRPPKGAIKIAVAVPLSGEQAALGESVKIGAQFAIKQLSKPLIEMGYGVDLVSFDDKAQPAEGANVAKKIVSDAEIFAVIGPLNSSVAISATTIYNDANLALISPAASDPKLTQRGAGVVNRVIGRDDQQGVAAATFVVKELGAKSVYVVNDTTAYGKNSADAFRDAAKKLGAIIAGEESAAEQNNFDATVAAIKNANPDAIYFGGIFIQGGTFLKQLRAKNIKAHFVGPDGLGDVEFPRFAGDAAVGAYFVSLVAPVNASETASFAKDLKSELGKDAPLFTAQAYDATAIALAAITRVAQENKLARPAVTQAIRATKDFKGITGIFSFTHAGEWASARYYLIKVASANQDQWNKNTVAKIIELAPPP
ncbi:MAG: branched-chain amino acid ABC transporter substrate-binding protein [Chloroflexi bacterium]|nr:branched-chain amino acid ABC transporter substrate-binding protein [Chloroflexota bacterium]